VRDPNNLTLLLDAARAATAEGDVGVARELLERYTGLAPLPPEGEHLSGLAALQSGDFTAAADAFRRLLAEHPADSALRFNLAWSLANLKDFAGALAVVDDATALALPQAATLRVQLLHQVGELDAAFADATRYLEAHSDDPSLLAALSVLAMDVEDIALAEDTARRAGNRPEALTTLGSLALGDDRQGDAIDLFDRALAQDPGAARAWVGRGLAELASGDNSRAARDIEHGAALFGDHIGSWIAAGWANVMKNDLDTARAHFERARAIDHSFAESHGSLAVVALLQGNIDEARRSTDIATRLDRNSFSTALARALLLDRSGRADAARAIVERALNTPIDGSGRTIAQALAKHGLSN
jgi:tetratricopeptide (TPR) repeat protein